MWKNFVQPDRSQMTIRRMRIARRMPKATNTHSENVTLIPFPQEQWLPKRLSVLRYTYIVRTVWHNTVSLHASYMQLRTGWRERINHVKCILLFYLISLFIGFHYLLHIIEKTCRILLHKLVQYFPPILLPFPPTSPERKALKSFRFSILSLVPNSRPVLHTRPRDPHCNVHISSVNLTS